MKRFLFVFAVICAVFSFAEEATTRENNDVKIAHNMILNTTQVNTNLISATVGNGLVIQNGVLSSTSSSALSGKTYDLSNQKALYVAISNIVSVLGGTIINFPQFQQ